MEKRLVCPHNELNFSIGGRNLGCNECGQMYVPVHPETKLQDLSYFNTLITHNSPRHNPLPIQYNFDFLNDLT